HFWAIPFESRSAGDSTLEIRSLLRLKTRSPSAEEHFWSRVSGQRKNPSQQRWGGALNNIDSLFLRSPLRLVHAFIRGDQQVLKLDRVCRIVMANARAQ